MFRIALYSTEKTRGYSESTLWPHRRVLCGQHGNAQTEGEHQHRGGQWNKETNSERRCGAGNHTGKPGKEGRAQTGYEKDDCILGVLQGDGQQQWIDRTQAKADKEDSGQDSDAGLAGNQKHRSCNDSAEALDENQPL